MQNGVTLATKEKDLDVKYGMINFREEREMARTSLRYILNDMNDIRKRYICLGFHLNEFIQFSYYYDFGYPTMEEFCDANLGMDKSAVSRCINVYRAFNGSKSVTYENGVEKRGSAMELDDRYKEYSYSQLCEMVSMDEGQRSQVKPDMTIKQIREIKKKNVSRDVSPVATSQLVKDDKKFDFDKYLNLKGIVLENYIKKLFSDRELPLTIFDRDGKKLYGNFVDILEYGDHGLFLRLWDNNDDIVEAIKKV